MRPGSIFYDGPTMKFKASTTIALWLALPLVLGGCARVNDITMRTFATSAQAHAVIGNAVLTGRTTLYADRTGTVDLQAGGDKGLSCMGTMRYTSTSKGVVNLRCSDGLEVQLEFTALTETSGHGQGRYPGGTASLTYGLDAEGARAWLLAPAGKQLVVSGDDLRIQ